MNKFDKEFTVGGRICDEVTGYLCLDVIGFEDMWEVVIQNIHASTLETILHKLNSESKQYPRLGLSTLSDMFRNHYREVFDVPKTTTPSDFIYMLESYFWNDYNGESKLIWDILKVDKYEIQ